MILPVILDPHTHTHSNGNNHKNGVLSFLLGFEEHSADLKTVCPNVKHLAGSKSSLSVCVALETVCMGSQG